MATIKKGITVDAGAWRKHLRPWGRRSFWKRQRLADKDFMRIETGHKSDGNVEVYRQRFTRGDDP